MSATAWTVPLEDAVTIDERLIGGKAGKLARLAAAGFRVPRGFAITTLAYEHFLAHGDLINRIRMEVSRKPLETMRWEEIWDAALRIRSGFVSQPIPTALADAIVAALDTIGVEVPVAVRSSAPGEDAAQRSFAGLHESVVDVRGPRAVLDAVKTVWASLWSDAALLYRKELGLAPEESRMAVVVQALIEEDRSGVAFARDPRNTLRNQMIVEAVPGLCSDLVDGVVDPDRWVLDRETGTVLAWHAGERDADPSPLLDKGDLDLVYRTLTRIESRFGWPPDVEWTGRGRRFTVLQARPITTMAPEPEDKRTWYLTLRPSAKRMQALRRRVVDKLIPELEALGQRLAKEPLESYDDVSLADAIEARADAVARWREIYWDDFIPFAHGVRQLGTTYNDAVRPADPYEFVGLLQGEQMLATRRNADLARLADLLRGDDRLRAGIAHIAADATDQAANDQLDKVRSLPGGQAFADGLEHLIANYLDIAYQGERLAGRPDLVLHTVLELATQPSARSDVKRPEGTQPADPAVLEVGLFEAVGPRRQAEVREILETARVSWRLRDDDNVLVGRLDAQLLRAVRLGITRLASAGRLNPGSQATKEAAATVAQALRDRSEDPVDLPMPDPASVDVSERDPAESPRQLVGQPAAPGVATGKARAIRSAEDLGRFKAGEVLVCDAIEPTMTHLIPLARAVVERRGGMLIHGAIIARELGIPCVNGVPSATEVLPDGEILTVDGYLGIVTVGPPDFALEGINPKG